MKRQSAAGILMLTLAVATGSFVSGIPTRAGEFLLLALVIPMAALGGGFFCWLGRDRS